MRRNRTSRFSTKKNSWSPARNGESKRPSTAMEPTVFGFASKAPSSPDAIENRTGSTCVSCALPNGRTCASTTAATSAKQATSTPAATLPPYA